MKFEIGDKVTHPVHGAGVVLESWLSKSTLKSTPTENYAVKFDKGGPLGFAENSTNDVKDLTKLAIFVYNIGEVGGVMATLGEVVSEYGLR